MGQNPFTTHAPLAPQRRVDPIIATATHDTEYCVNITAPPAHTLAELDASPLGAHTILVEGRLAPKMPACVYVACARTAIYGEPSRAALVGYVPAGSQLVGSAPSNRGWIALDDDESFALADDGTLALQRAPHGPHDFAKRVELPSDAILSRATLTRGTGGSAARRAGEPRKWRVVYGPRVAVRSGTHTNATLLGALARGDVIDGTIDAVDSNWVRLSSSSKPAFVMIRHPSFGTLLAPVDGPAEQAALEDADGAFTIRVPRLAPSQTTGKRPGAPSQHVATPAASSAHRTHQAACSGKAARPAKAAGPASARPAGGTAGMATARRMAKQEAGATRATSVTSFDGAVLRECAASVANVQAPSEKVEAWVACDGGGFAPLATA